MKIKPKKCIGSKIEKSNENNDSNDVEPTAEYRKQRPKSKKLEMTAPKIKYFKPASVENSELRWNVAKIQSKRKISLKNGKEITKFKSENRIR